MKAWVLHAPGDIRYEEVKRPERREGWSLIRVGAAGICGSDLPRILTTGAHRHPLIPGHEFAGIVEETGETEGRIRPGSRVGIFPLIPCMKCRSCRERKYEMCSNYNYLGSRCDGGFAEYCLVPDWNLLPLTENVTMQQAALLEPMSVAMHAIRRVSFKSKKDRILVIGLGTIGLCVCMLLSVLGYENLYAVGNKQYQQGMFDAAGGQKNRYHEYTKISDSEEYDVVFECVGKNSAIRYAIETAGVGGQVVFVGNPAEDIIFPKEEYWKILRRQLRISGSWNSSFLGFSDKDAAQDDWNKVLSLVSEKKIHPEKLISHVLDFSGLPEGLELMRNRTMPSTKVMLIRGE